MLYSSLLRTVIPDPSQLETRVEAVISAFQAVEDSNGIPLFKDNMTNEWKLQRTHIRRGCLSDPRICPVAGTLLIFHLWRCASSVCCMGTKANFHPYISVKMV